MGKLRTLLFGATLAAGTGLAALTPAHADTDTRFYLGPDGVRIYVDKDGNRYSDRYHRHRYYGDRRHHWRARCYNNVSYDWRWGERYRVVDRVCRDRYGRTRVVDRDYYRVGGW